MNTNVIPETDISGMELSFVDAVRSAKHSIQNINTFIANLNVVKQTIPDDDNDSHAYIQSELSRQYLLKETAETFVERFSAYMGSN